MTETPKASQKVFGIDLVNIYNRLWIARRQISKRILLLEFTSTCLNLVEMRFDAKEVHFSHARRVELPDEATERGVPSDPAAMAQLIRSLCKEEKIPAHRASVVIPPEAAYTKLIDLPRSLSDRELRQYILDPSSGVQTPIPLSQTDFDISPSGLPAADPQKTSYFITCIPQKLINQLFETLEAAQLSLQSVDFAINAQLRLAASQVAFLPKNHIFCLLELQRDTTHFALVNQSGPIHLLRLPAIREFPDQIIDPDKAAAMLAEGLTPEALVAKDKDYLPISELDTKVIVHEIRDALESFCSTYGLSVYSVFLSGQSSAHPGLAEILQAELRYPVSLLTPLNALGVGSISFSQPLVQQSLSRLVGMGLRFLPVEAIIEPTAVEEVASNPVQPLVATPPAKEPIPPILSNDVSQIASVDALDPYPALHQEPLKSRDNLTLPEPEPTTKADLSGIQDPNQIFPAAQVSQSVLSLDLTLDLEIEDAGRSVTSLDRSPDTQDDVAINPIADQDTALWQQLDEDKLGESFSLLDDDDESMPSLPLIHEELPKQQKQHVAVENLAESDDELGNLSF